MIRIDAHVHFGYDNQDRGATGLLSVHQKEALDHVRTLGIDKACLIPFNEAKEGDATTFNHVNSRLREFLTLYPGSFVGGVRLNPHDDLASIKQELMDAVKWARMVKLHTRSQNVKLSSRELQDTLALLDRINKGVKLPLLIHSEAQKSSSYFRQWGKLANKYPNIPFIIAHIGSTYYLRDLTPAIREGFYTLTSRNDNVFVDISACFPEVVEEVAEFLPSKKLIWGTDFCYRAEDDIREVLSILEKTDDSDDILGRTFLSTIHHSNGGNGKSGRTGKTHMELENCLSFPSESADAPNSSFDLLAYRLRGHARLGSAMPIIPSSLYFLGRQTMVFKHWVAQLFANCGKEHRFYGSVLYDLEKGRFQVIPGWKILEMGQLDGGIQGIKIDDRKMKKKEFALNFEKLLGDVVEKESFPVTQCGEAVI